MREYLREERCIFPIGESVGEQAVFISQFFEDGSIWCVCVLLHTVVQPSDWIMRALLTALID